MPATLTEFTPLAEAAGADVGPSGRMLVQAISAGLGSSGYYSPKVLEEAATKRLIKRGTPLHIDHATDMERHERPGRSVDDIAGFFTEDAYWDADAQALVGEIQVVAPHRERLAELAPFIGLSISGSATDVKVGEHNGRKVPIIEGLATIDSVDFVTRAGRGGMVRAVYESALPSEVTERVVARGVTEATANDMRDQLQQAVRTTYASGEQAYAYVEDFDPDASVAWYTLDSPDVTGLFAHDFTAEGAVALTGTPRPVRRVTSYVPVDPAADTPTEESRRTPMAQIEDARLRTLEEAHGRVPTLEAERDAATQRATVAERERDTLRARESARPLVTAVLAESRTLPAAMRGRVAESLLGQLPLNAEGRLDEGALRAATEAARTVAETEFATALTEAGYGKPRDLRATDPAGDDAGISEAEYAATLGLTRIGG